MSFFAFVILCIIVLFGYYIYLILKPEKERATFENDNLTLPDLEVVLNEPIKVTEAMVTFYPNATSKSSSRSEQTTQYSDNKYSSTPSPQTIASSPDENFFEFGKGIDPFSPLEEEEQVIEQLRNNFSILSSLSI